MAHIERVKVFAILNDLVNDCADKDEFYNRVFDAVDAMIAAEVVPASEVTRLEKLLDDKCDRCIAREKANAAKEIFTEIEFDIHNLDFDREETRAIAIEGIIANAKKKYTEDKE